MKKVWIVSTFLFAGLYSSAQTLALNPSNPHYFIYKGKPIVLITSGEHYGAVINSSIDYKKYLNVLKKYHFNLTRVFTGSYFEGNYQKIGRKRKKKMEEKENTLAPDPANLLVPWARSNVPGYANGGNKFDLNRWNNQYFVRLRDFCEAALERNIIIEITFFSANYRPSNWRNSPLNYHNNINLTKEVAYNAIYDSSNKNLIHYQLAMVRKIVKEVNNFDNIYFEICNEPYWLNGIPEVDTSVHGQQVTPEIYEWQRHIALAIEETEQKLPKKHLIAQNFANTYLKITNLDSNVSVLNFHYAYPPQTVTDNYSLNKPVSFDETDDGLNANERRKESWAFMMAGGAVYDNLDWSFTTDDMTGKGLNTTKGYKAGKPVKLQLKVLQQALASFNFIDAEPLDSSYKIKGMQVYGLGIKGKDYMMYLSRTKSFRPEIWNIPLPDGRFRVRWVNPSNGKVKVDSVIQSYSNHAHLRIPSFNEDQVLRIDRLQ